MADGKLPVLPNGRIDAEAALGTRRQAAERAEEASGGLAAATPGAGPVLSAKEQRDLLALRRETLAFFEQAGRLTDAGRATTARGEVFRRLRYQLLGAADEIGAQVAGLTDARIAAARARRVPLGKLTDFSSSLIAEAAAEDLADEDLE